ncbi:hypothetical protein ABIF44_002967 [Bradyrhizobium japonicum]|nr:hypothetical protein [Bradyrhizobium japonicum]MCS3990728.1 hypothetical protein [Bradyrhizobium japonicum]MCS4014461.1 hypothetical protein [Bradyrhizobium japonicum]MCS4210467.1 hypothetical protein [Bradyrhizobium japonicum]MDH6171062.1 hypothetical protein [Bradyrhizobium japonicum]
MNAAMESLFRESESIQAHTAFGYWTAPLK